MANRLEKLADIRYLPAIPWVIARPAGCVTYTRFVRAVGGTRSSTTGGGFYQHTNALATKEKSYTYTYHTYRPVRDTVCYPAVEGVEGRFASLEKESIIGWDAGAHSIDWYTGDLAFSFSFRPDGVGMLCGLHPPGAPVGSYNALTHALQMTAGVLEVVESGRVVAARPSSALVDVEIIRIADRVIYRAGDWTYESTIPSRGVVGVAACLYMSGDYIDDPVVTRPGGLEAFIPWGWDDPLTASRIAAAIAWGWGGTSTIGDGFARLDIPVVARASDYATGTARIDAGAATVRGNDTPRVDSDGLIWATTAAIAANGIGVRDVPLQVDAGAVRMRAAEVDYGSCRIDAGAPWVFGVELAEAANAGSASEALFVWDQYHTDPVIHAVIDETLRIGGTLDVLLVLDAGLVEYLVAGDKMDANAVLVALLQSALSVSDNTAYVRASVLQYVTNLMTGAVGRYEGFDFSGFLKVGMDTYGWKRDGLYRMAYAEDTGEEIQALIDFAAEDFDTTNRKSIRALFFGVDTDGALYARLVDDNDCDATYRVIPHGDTHRANPAQRPTSRFWRLRLEIVDATFADLDNVEWKAATTGRRTRS